MVVSLARMDESEQDVLTVQDDLQLLQESLLIHGGQRIYVICFSLFILLSTLSTRSFALRFSTEKGNLQDAGSATSDNLLVKLLEKHKNSSRSHLEAH